MKLDLNSMINGKASASNVPAKGFVLSPGTHNFVVLILGCVLLFYISRAALSYIEARHAVNAHIAQKNALMPTNEDHIPQTIFIHLEGMSPAIGLMHNFVQPHVIEFIGNHRLNAPLRIDDHSLTTHLALPSVDDQGGLLTWNQTSQCFTIKLLIHQLPRRISKLFLMYGVDRKVVQSMTDPNKPGLGIGHFFSFLGGSTMPSPFLLGQSVVIDKSHSQGLSVDIPSPYTNPPALDLHEKYPIVAVAEGGVEGDDAHILVLDCLGRGGSVFQPDRDGATKRLYAFQQYYIETPAVIQAWSSRLTILPITPPHMGRRLGSALSTPRLEPRGSDLIMVDPQPSDHVKTILNATVSNDFEIRARRRVKKPMERYGVDDQDPCLVCLERRRDVTLLPCRHAPLCGECLGEIRKNECPICRSPLDAYLQYEDFNENQMSNHGQNGKSPC